MKCPINQSLACNVCNKVLKSKLSFKIHKKTHSGEKNHRCKHCNKKFSNNNIIPLKAFK